MAKKKQDRDVVDRIDRNDASDDDAPATTAAVDGEVVEAAEGQIVQQASCKAQPQTQALATRALTPAEMLSVAVQQNAPVENIERLMGLQERWEANEARKAFEIAMVAFSASVPTILKSRVVDFTTAKGRTHYKFAGLPESVEQIQGLMAQCQLSRRWKDEEPKKVGNIRLRCIVSHVLGHGESFAAEAPPDGSGNKNEAQAVASIITYLRRTTLFAVLGLVAKDELDDDGEGGAKRQEERPASAGLVGQTQDQGQARPTPRQAFVDAVLAKCPGMAMDAIKRVYEAAVAACGTKDYDTCREYVERNDVAVGADGTIVQAVSPGAADGQEGPLAFEDAPAVQYECQVCGQGYAVLPAGGRCNRREGKAVCGGDVARVME